ncbi:MAG: tRNA pseudouridine(38-40) synthase TruA [Pseudomonadota bacterium]
MPRYKLTIEYHGAPFVGWQRQADGLSVQGVLEQAAARIDPAAPAIAGAGRTDAGVHATGQVAHVDLSATWDPFRLSEALNYHLKPHPVAVVAVDPVPEDFHARFSATARHYRYRIISRRAPLTLEAGLAWRVAYDLDADAMQDAARHLIGNHDFTTFRSAQCQAASPVKTLDVLDVRRDGAEISLILKARSFLHNQVRSFAGTLERVGAGKWHPDDVKTALEACERAACGPVAPPDGLYLTRVDYGATSSEPTARSDA